MRAVDFNVLRREITMQDVLNQLDFQPTNRSGKQLPGPRPVHGPTSAAVRFLCTSTRIDTIATSATVMATPWNFRPISITCH